MCQEPYALFGVDVRCADHLWKVDNNGLARLSADKDIKLIEVSVDQTRVSEAHDKIHERRVELSR